MPNQLPRPPAPVNREAWLTSCASLLAPLFVEQGVELPPFRITCGWPSRRALSKNRANGEAWQPEASADATAEIFISPTQDTGLKVAGIMLHEMTHVATPGAGHKAPFSQLGKAIGLEGKPTSMLPGADLRERLNTLIESLGDYPHAKLTGSTSASKKQSTRLIKVICPTGDSEYTCRVTRKWLDEYGPPSCGCCLQIMEEV